VLSSVIPLYLIARGHLGDRASATLVALTWLVYPSVHGVILNEFHSFALLAPLALWWVLFLDRKMMRAYWLGLALVLFVREDAALFACGIGFYALVALPGRRRVGLVTIGFALAYLTIVKLAIMPESALLSETSEDAIGYANRYRRLIPKGGGASDAVLTLLGNPGFLFAHVLTKAKLAAVVTFLLPLGALPLLAGRRLLLALYGAAFCFLASHRSIYYPLLHYSSALYPMLFAALPWGITRARSGLVRLGWTEAAAGSAVSGWLAGGALAMTIGLGAWSPTGAFALHTPVPHHLDPDERRAYAWLHEQLARIPEQDSVAASNRVAAHVSNREHMRILQQQIETDWVVLHEQDMQDTHQRWILGSVRAGDYVEEAAFDDRLRVLRRTTPAPK
jgi:hypothetical protein